MILWGRDSQGEAANPGKAWFDHWTEKLNLAAAYRMKICLNVPFYSKYICCDRSYIVYMSLLLGHAASVARLSDTAGYYKDYLQTFEV